MNTLKTILISFLVFIVTALGVYNFMPFSWLPYFNFHTTQFGTSLTEIASTDQLSGFPTIYNANLTALNSGKMETSTTSVKGITTLAGLTTVGTITTGTWTADAIGVGYGGTGTTSPTSKQIMFGNGASGLQVIGFGTSGQFLTSGGDATLPSWTTSSIDLTASYNFTNAYFGVTNLFSSTTEATTTNTQDLNVTGTAAFTGTVTGISSASSTIYTSSGTYVKSDSVVSVFVEVWGAGASGGKGSNNGGGGGGGEYISTLFSASDISASEVVTIGTGGAAKSSEGTGNSGGNSSLGSLIVGSGGTGGGSGGGADIAGGDCGIPDNFTTGTSINGLWGGGVSASEGENGEFCGGGGGADNASAQGKDGGNAIYGGAGGGGVEDSGTASSASGGSSAFGGDGGAAGGDASDGTDGTVPGGGGGGAGPGGNSGAGANGQVKITEFF